MILKIIYLTNMEIQKQDVEKTSFLTAATLLISSGVVAIDKNVYAGAILVIAGVALFLTRELRKKK